PAPDPITPHGPAGEAGIDHIVVVMMENRSFDHFLGWMPGSEGRPAGRQFADDEGALHEAHHLTTYASCQYADPDHGYAAGRRQYAAGACDGFLLDSPDTFPIGYYEQADLPFWGTAAPAWTVCDQYFAATMGPTFPNRFFQHCGQSDRWGNWLTISNMTTIWDRLAAAGLQGRYYFSDAPFAALLGVRHLLVSRTVDQFLGDCAAGRLPHVSYIDPGFIIPQLGSSTDYHPPSDIRAGERFLHRIYEAVTTGPGWERTVLVVNFDEWGGFADHVAPVEAPDASPHMALRGFRVPCLVVSPHARRNHVAHDVYDHASVLRMIEWGFDLEPLAPRDAAANNLADVLDLGGAPNLDAPHWEMPAFVPTDCTPAFLDSLWKPVRDLARAQGWPV
ncbi:MAG TPA: alkaline phosphatase family protein, partial [Microthrixaceae bacterium]|nr:alkaline phosphatase family protein [Microthrixaceae bacterium]